METTSRFAVRVGIFFTLALVIVLGLSLQIGKGGLINDQYEIVANFRQAIGVEPGTRVALRGVPIGTVKSLDWDPTNYRVRTVLTIQEKYLIPENATAVIQVSSLLGGNFVNITVEEGPEADEYLEVGDEIATAETPNINEAISNFTTLTQDAQELIANLDRNQAEALAKIQGLVDENREELRETSASFSRLGPRLEELAGRLNEMTSGVSEGRGTLGALYQDDQLYQDLKEFIDVANEVSEQVRSGEGTLGSLIYGEDLIAEAETVMGDLRRAAQEVEGAVSENREGMRNLVVALRDAAPRLEEAVGDLNEITTKINSGQGTLGRLVNDPTLYQDAQRTVNQVGESFESAEEQGVFRSVLGLVFGALI